MIFKISINEKWPNLLFIILLLIWIISLFIAPLMVSKNTIGELNGCSNLINYGYIWADLPLYPRIIYTIGDFACHQINTRSFYINGNQMPVCVRCVAIYFGFLCALVYTLFIPNNQNHRRYFFHTLPNRWRNSAINIFGEKFLPFILIFLFLLPVALDGGIQLFTDYESSNITRILTGIPAGWLGGILLGALINT